VKVFTLLFKSVITGIIENARASTSKIVPNMSEVKFARFKELSKLIPVLFAANICLFYSRISTEYEEELIVRLVSRIIPSIRYIMRP